MGELACVTHRCKCGRLTYDHIVREHDWNPSPSLTDEWDPIKDTKKYPTNAYGEINFLNDENDILPLVSLSISDMEKLCSLVSKN